MSNFATTTDLIQRWRPMSADEIAKANTLLTDCSDALRVYAHERGRNLDQMIADYSPLATVAKSVVCDVVRREMCDSADTPAMSQLSQSVNGFSVQGTFLSAGGGLFIKNNELKMLGILKQKVKGVNLYDD